MKKSEYELMVDIAENAIAEFDYGDDCGAIMELKRIENLIINGKRVSRGVQKEYEQMIDSVRQGRIKDLNAHDVERFKFMVQRFLMHKKC